MWPAYDMRPTSWILYCCDLNYRQRWQSSACTPGTRLRLWISSHLIHTTTREILLPPSLRRLGDQALETVVAWLQSPHLARVSLPPFPTFNLALFRKFWCMEGDIRMEKPSSLERRYCLLLSVPAWAAGCVAFLFGGSFSLETCCHQFRRSVCIVWGHTQLGSTASNNADSFQPPLRLPGAHICNPEQGGRIPFTVKLFSAQTDHKMSSRQDSSRFGLFLLSDNLPVGLVVGCY